MLLADESDIEEGEWLHAGSVNPVFDFSNDPDENAYSNTDGKPFAIL